MWYSGVAYDEAQWVFEQIGVAMEKNKITYKSIDEYILQFPYEIAEILKTLRKVIKDAAPDAEEKISYQMPTFYLHGNLIHFAVFKNHIGLYPTPSGIGVFSSELSEYASGKGSVQFPLDKPIPYGLVKKIVKFRVSENIRKAQNTSKKKK
jgi:uncharacterized protein YdhG (YjbR/CyaY superfamily)